MKYINSYIKYILLMCIAIIATACSSGSCDSNSDNKEVIMDSSDGGVANGATDAALIPLIVLQFNQPMNASTVNSSTVTLTVATNSQQSKGVQDNQVIPIGQIVANNDSTKFYFSPVSPLQPGTKYMVNLLGSIQTLRGTFITPVSFSFTTTTDADNNNPTVSIIYPGNGQIKVSLTPNIQVKFSEAVQNVNTTTVTLRQGSPTGSIVAIGNITPGANNTYTFSPSSPLKDETLYYVVLTDAITDIAGNPLIAKSFSFTTGKFTIPTVSMINPSNNAQNVSLTPTITLQFSESVDNVNDGSVGLYQESSEGQRILITDIVAGADNTYTFSPISPLTPGTTYYVVLTNAIKDAAGNSLAPTILSFATAKVWQYVGESGFSSGSAFYQSLAIDSNNVPYVAYQDWSLAQKTTVMKFNNASGAWENVGNAGFSAGVASYQSLAIDSNNVPYVAYQDGGNSNKTTVMKFNNGSGAWENVGSPGFSAGGSIFQSLAIASDGTPYVAYQDWNFANKTTVMMFNGTSWVNVGSPGFSAGAAEYQSLAIAPDGTPYVAYGDYGDGGKTTVMKFNGNSWENVGSPGFSAGRTAFQSLAIASDGTPYVAYQDWNFASKTTVMMFNGTSWVNVGNAGFSAGVANYQSLAIDSNNVPYVAYKDGGNNNKTTVMKFNNGSGDWENVGSPGFSAGSADFQSLAIAPDDGIYVAYRGAPPPFKTTVMMFK